MSKIIKWQDNPEIEKEGFDIVGHIKPRGDFEKFVPVIAAYDKKEAVEGKILFTGSSGFTMWSVARGNNIDLEDALLSSKGEKVCYNRAFGGSTMHLLCRYYDNIIKKNRPRALVITSFVNDLSRGYTPEEVMECVEWLFCKVRKDFPGIPMYITDVRPNAVVKPPEKIEELKEMNARLLGYAEVHPDVKVLELSKEPMFYTDKKYAGTYTHINTDIFVKDKLHYTHEGYAMFAEIFRRELKEILG